MNSREGILTALSHREPDRVPYDLGVLGPSGISIQAYRNLLKLLHSEEKGEVGDIASQRAKLSEDFLQRFRVDTRSFRVRPQGSWSGHPARDSTRKHHGHVEGTPMLWDLPQES